MLCQIWDQHASMDGILSLSLCLLGGVFYKQAPMKKVDHDHTETEDNGTPSKGKSEGVELVGTAPLLQSPVHSRPNHRGTNIT